jgi:hypothetical protein
VRLGKPDSSRNMGLDILSFANEPLTLAVVGCGQRGSVCILSPALFDSMSLSHAS